MNEVHDLVDQCWDDPALAKLWRYNLHYFDDLNAKDATLRTEWQRALLLRWIRENPPAVGTGWEPYPISLRIVNWIKWALGGNALPQECVQSLAVQARWLSRRLEIHLLGNHLFVNAKALVFAGLFFEGAEAEQWLKKGLQLLVREIPEQILADGAQFERSPMYHSLALEDMLDLCNVTRTYQTAIPESWAAQVSGWSEIVGRMRYWLSAMCHPDGEISFFNDAAIGISPSPTELNAYSLRLGFPPLSDISDGIIYLPDSGYIRAQWGTMVALLDVAPIGPDYMPGHAHADTLSFELSLFGQRLFVNSGTSCYGTSAERLRQRGTAAHNTVMVDEVDSSEVWDGFRVARRACPVGLKIVQQGELAVVSCAHNGYRWLDGEPRHMREWRCGGNELEIEDRVSGSFEYAEARFHLHPSVKISEKYMDSEGGAKVELRLPYGQKAFFIVSGGILREEAATWHPEFGCSEPNLCLTIRFNRSLLRTHLKWSSVV